MLGVQHFTRYGLIYCVDLSLDVMPGDIGLSATTAQVKTTHLKSIVGAQPFEGGVIFVDSKCAG